MPRSFDSITCCESCSLVDDKDYMCSKWCGILYSVFLFGFPIFWVFYGISCYPQSATNIPGYNQNFENAINTVQFPYMLILDYYNLLNGENANTSNILPQLSGYTFYTCTQQYASNYTSMSHTLNGTFTLFSNGMTNNSVNITGASLNTVLSVDGHANQTCASGCTNLTFQHNISFFSNSANFTLQYWQFSTTDHHPISMNTHWPSTCVKINGSQFVDGIIMGLPNGYVYYQPTKIQVFFDESNSGFNSAMFWLALNFTIFSVKLSFVLLIPFLQFYWMIIKGIYYIITCSCCCDCGCPCDDGQKSSKINNDRQKIREETYRSRVKIVEFHGKTQQEPLKKIIVSDKEAKIIQNKPKILQQNEIFAAVE